MCIRDSREYCVIIRYAAYGKFSVLGECASVERRRKHESWRSCINVKPVAVLEPVALIVLTSDCKSVSAIAQILKRHRNACGIRKGAVCSASVSVSYTHLAAKIYELLYLISKDNETIPAKYTKITAAINEVKLHYFQNEKTSDYADLCGMSESNFRTLFKEYTGNSFIDYRNTLRIGEAHKLISGGECTVSEAAYFTAVSYPHPDVYTRQV